MSDGDGVTLMEVLAPRPAATLAGPTDYVSHDYGSPPEFVEVAHAVFRGPPTLDPFSSEKWNDAGIRAHRIITAEQDGFKTPWFPACGKYLGDDDATTPQLTCIRTRGHSGLCDNHRGDEESVIVNPPGNRTGSNVKAAWALLDAHHRAGHIAGGGLWVGFNLNQLQTLQHVARSPLHPDFLRCIPRKRSAYLEAPGVITKQPRAPSWLLLLPATNADRANRQRATFTVMASKLGAVF